MREEEFVSTLSQMPDCQALLWASERAGRRFAIFGDTIGNLVRRWGTFDAAETRLLSFVDPFSPVILLFDAASDWDPIAESLASCVPLAPFLSWHARRPDELRAAEEQAYLDPIPANRLLIWFDGKIRRITAETIGFAIEDCLSDEQADPRRWAHFVRRDPVSRARLALLYGRYAAEAIDSQRRDVYWRAASTLGRDLNTERDYPYQGLRRWSRRLRRSAFNYLFMPSDFETVRKQWTELGSEAPWFQLALLEGSSSPIRSDSLSKIIEADQVAATATAFSGPRLVFRLGSEPLDGVTPWIRFRKANGRAVAAFNEVPFGVGGGVAAFRSRRDSGLSRIDGSMLGINGRVRRDVRRDPDLPDAFDVIPLTGFVTCPGSVVMRLEPGLAERASVLGSFECAAVRALDSEARAR